MPLDQPTQCCLLSMKVQRSISLNMSKGINLIIVSIKKLYSEFERLQAIMQELKRENQ